MAAHLETHFDEDITAELSQQWKKECESHESNAMSNFWKKEEWYTENSTEEFRRDTPEETLKANDRPNQTSRNVNFVQRNKSKHENNRRQAQYQWTTANFKSSRRKFFQQNPENSNTNYKQKEVKWI